MSNDDGHGLGPDELLLAPMRATRRPFYYVAVVLLGLATVGFFAWVHQLRWGLQTTGLNHTAYWGVYVANFVFFAGISMAGTFISAVLRLSHAEWRRPITRAAEVITLLGLLFAGANVLADLGRPDRLVHLLLRPNFASPLMWDVCCIGLYFCASLTYLYLPLIPDIALLRDRGARPARLYRILAAGWRGTTAQQRKLHRAIGAMAVLVIPLAVFVHSVVSWVFAMTVQPLWHSTLFGPYFVVGATYSGIAALLLVMALMRRFHGLHAYLKPVHFQRMGTLLLVLALVWGYLTFAEHLTALYGQQPDHLEVLYARVGGRFAPLFWSMVATCFALPLLVLARPSKRTVARTVVAAISVVVGMWLERVTIVVPTLMHPRVPIDGAAYWPTWVEVGISVGSLACFAFFYLLFSRLFPIVSIWEIREGRERAMVEVTDRLRSYLPPDAPPEP